VLDFEAEHLGAGEQVDPGLAVDALQTVEIGGRRVVAPVALDAELVPADAGSSLRRRGRGVIGKLACCAAAMKASATGVRSVTSASDRTCSGAVAAAPGIGARPRRSRRV
jgi:hypothetical protein